MVRLQAPRGGVVAASLEGGVLMVSSEGAYALHRLPPCDPLPPFVFAVVNEALDITSALNRRRADMLPYLVQPGSGRLPWSRVVRALASRGDIPEIDDTSTMTIRYMLDDDSWTERVARAWDSVCAAK
jgi:hypothetical protein